MKFCKRCGKETERYAHGSARGRCKVCAGAISRKWSKVHPERRKEINRRAHGHPEPTRPCPELCEIGCGRKAAHLEHCHETGIFRGWTCSGCNSAIAALSDNLDVAIERLTRYRAVFVAESWLAIPGDGLPIERKVKNGK